MQSGLAVLGILGAIVATFLVALAASRGSVLYAGRR